MGKCKNIECANETIQNRVYCSLSCRNYYVNKYLRDYSNVSKSLIKTAKDKYSNLPKKCKKCNKDISYENRESNYCSKSCLSANANISRKGIKLNMTEDGLKNIASSNRERYGHKIGEYELNPNKCINCNGILSFKKRFSLHCSKSCRNQTNRKNMDIYNIYKKDASFKFNLNEYPNEFDLNLIKKYGWYSPSNSKKPNIEGISRDHKISIANGFKLGIDPKLLAHPANCELMRHTANISKNSKSSLTIDELIIRINEWDLKYKSSKPGGST